MNPNTGELRALERDEKLPDGFERIQRGTAEARQAMLKLRLAALSATAAMAGFGRAVSDTKINLQGHTPLAVWAKKKRKAKIAAASRRRNRK